MNEQRTPLTPVTGLSRAAGLPAPPARRPAAALQVAAEPAQSARETPRPNPKLRTRATTSRDATVTRAVSISLPVDLAAQVRVQARSAGVSQADVLMDAVLAHRDHLTDLIVAARPAPARDDLFVRSAPRAPAGPYVALSLRMKSPNVDVLDRLVQEHGAASRSQLCAAALAAHLEP